MMTRISNRTRVAATLALALAIAGCGGAAKQAVTQTDAVLAASDVAAVQRTDLIAGVPVSGTLTPGHVARLTVPRDEVIEQVLVREGQKVAKGQVLARLRSDAAEAMAVSAEAQLKVANADLEREKNLLAEGAVAQRDVDAAEAAARSAAAAAATAKKQLDDSIVRAPFDGMVSKRSAESGDRGKSGDPMFEVVDTSELEFEATVPSEFVQFVKPGAAVALDVTGYPSGSIEGRVARVNPTADEATRQVKVYVVVPNRDSKLVGGLFASGNVVTKESRSALAVPTAAVRSENGASYALVVDHGRLARRAVRTGLHDAGHDLIEVLDGLNAGDTAVVGPIEGLVVGQLVRITGKES
jgi:RND family efflux transporter MFP subunit